MPFIFPKDSDGKAGAVKYTADGNDFYVPTREQGSEAITANRLTVTTAGTRVQLPNIPCRKVMIVGLRSNVGYIYIGGADVSSTVYGVELLSRDSITIEVSNANLLYMDASASGEGVSYLAI